MTRADELFSRQSQWQRSRRDLSWPEKIREAERLRPSLEAFRQMRMSRGVHAAVLSQRPHARARLVPLHQDDGQFDREFWQSVPRGERVAALWQMVQDWAEWRGVPTHELQTSEICLPRERRRR